MTDVGVPSPLWAVLPAGHTVLNCMRKQAEQAKQSGAASSIILCSLLWFLPRNPSIKPLNQINHSLTRLLLISVYHRNRNESSMHYKCVDVQRPGEVVRALELDYRWLGATRWGGCLELKLGLRAASAPLPRAISPAPPCDPLNLMLLLPSH